jgi:hypothetical protein
MGLTAVAIKAAKARDKQYKLTDSGGLHLLVLPSGARYWRMNYRYLGKSKTLAFGVWPDVDLAGARAKRDAARRLLGSGIDPAEQAKLDKVAAIGIAAVVADEKENVGAHDRVSGSVAGEFPDRLTPESGWGRASAPQGGSAAEAPRETCKSRLERAGRAAPNTGRRLCGLLHERIQAQGVRACRTGDLFGQMNWDYW